MCWSARSLGPSGLSAGNFLARGGFLPPTFPSQTHSPDLAALLINYPGVTLIDAVPAPGQTRWFGWSLGLDTEVCLKLLVLSCRHCADLGAITQLRLQTGSLPESLKGSRMQRC